MGIKNTASEERLFCLRGLSEDDTILFGVSISSENLIETYWSMFPSLDRPYWSRGGFYFLWVTMSARRISLIYQIISCSIIRPIIFRFNFIYISARREMEFSSVCINNIRRCLRLLGCSSLLFSGNPFLFSLFGSSVCFSLFLSFRSGLSFSISFCFDKMINKLRSLDRVDGTSEYYKNNAIAYLSDLANYLDRIGVKTIKMRPEVAASIGAHNKNTN